MKRAIEETALPIIESDGLKAVSLRGIAKQLGVSETAPYHHFASKDELVSVVAEGAYHGLQERMLAAIDTPGEGSFARLEAMFRSFVEYRLESAGRFSLMWGEHMLVLSKFPKFYAAAHPVRLLLRDVVANCIGTDVEDTLTIEHSTWALGHGLIWLITESEIRLEEGSGEAEELIGGALDLLVRGIWSSHP